LALRAPEDDTGPQRHGGNEFRPSQELPVGWSPPTPNRAPCLIAETRKAQRGYSGLLRAESAPWRVPSWRSALPSISTILVLLWASALPGCRKDLADEVPELSQGLQHPDPDERYTAVSSLGRLGADAKKAVPALTEALKDKDANVRMAAAYALPKIGPEALEAIPALVAAADDPAPLVRSAVVYALSVMAGDTASVRTALQKAQRDPDETVRKDAAEAVKRLENRLKYEQKAAAKSKSP
jgi:hypothetical protein